MGNSQKGPAISERMLIALDVSYVTEAHASFLEVRWNKAGMTSDVVKRWEVNGSVVTAPQLTDVVSYVDRILSDAVVTMLVVQGVLPRT